jgi:hypothetical protein
MQFDDSLESSYLAQVWNVWAPSCYKVFIWLLLQGRIWTADCLLRRKWKNEYFYPLCIRNMETVLHLFVECPVAHQIWLEISNWTLFPTLHPQSWDFRNGVADWYNGLALMSRARGSNRARSLIMIVCWTIWCKRNGRIFEGKEKRILRLVTEIRKRHCCGVRLVLGIWLESLVTEVMSSCLVIRVVSKCHPEMGLY